MGRPGGVVHVRVVGRRRRRRLLRALHLFLLCMGEWVGGLRLGLWVGACVRGTCRIWCRGEELAPVAGGGVLAWPRCSSTAPLRLLYGLSAPAHTRVRGGGRASGQGAKALGACCRKEEVWCP